MSLYVIVIAAFIWSAIVWCAASLLCRLRPAANTSQAIWRSAAALMVLPFIAAPFMPGFQGEAIAALANNAVIEGMVVRPEAPLAPVLANAETGLQLPSFETILWIVLGAGWLTRFACFIRGQVRLQRVKRASVPSPLTSNTWASRLGLSRAPSVRYISHGSPFVAGIGGAHIYLPEPLGNGAEVGQIIAHECTHLKRGDLITRPIERFVSDLFWFSPFSWAMRERLDYWREAAVDAEAVKLTGDRIAYARALTLAARLARPVTPMPVAAFILPKEGTLKMRLTDLLAEAPHRPRKLALASIAAAALLVPLALAQGNALKGEQTPDAPNLPVAEAEKPANPEKPEPQMTAEVFYTHPVLKEGRLTSHYGLRLNPKTKKPGWHNGVDVAAYMGAPIFAPASGEVTFADEKNGYGKMIDVKLPNGNKVRFAHLKSILVSKGDIVTGGQKIAKMGKSYSGTGPHLHLEVWKHGKPYDPLVEPGLVITTDLKITEKVKADRAEQERKAQEQIEALKSDTAPATSSKPDHTHAADGTVIPINDTADNNIDECKAINAKVGKMKHPSRWVKRLGAAEKANSAASVGSVSDEDISKRTIKWPKPKYPKAAIEAGLTGGCLILFDLSAEGIAQNADAQCTDNTFKTEAEAMRAARFKPVEVNGKPVPVKGITYPMTFCMN